jgi:hypothetical protein
MAASAASPWVSRVPHTLQARYLWVTGNQVVQRRLDQRKRAHPRVPARAGEQRPQDPV